MTEQSNISVDHFFDPSSKDFIHDPVPTLERLSAEFPIARFEAVSYTHLTLPTTPYV